MLTAFWSAAERVQLAIHQALRGIMVVDDLLSYVHVDAVEFVGINSARLSPKHLKAVSTRPSIYPDTAIRILQLIL